MELREQALRALCCPQPEQKVRLVQAIYAQKAAIDLDTHAALSALPDQLPGRPQRPTLIDPAQVPQRSPFTPLGHAALVHAICHIEFNAINLALDAVWRFAGMPAGYYQDWLQVAAEEAHHFGLLHRHLRQLPKPNEPGNTWDYGDFDAHNGLWTMCEQTAHDITARMALVPRTLEARGLDATPLIQAKLSKVKTPQAQEVVALLDIILRDEVGHVAIGNHWYRYLCEQQGLDPVAHYITLAERHRAPKLKPPFNQAARRKAGFSDQELDYLLGV
ncbi:MAG: hypothetical protein RI959_1623 [Pseudomonadota bacterium]